MNYDIARVTDVHELEAAYLKEALIDKRAAAEIAYALACRYRNQDVGGHRRFDLARDWANRAVDILDSLPSETLSDVASAYNLIGSIPIPSLLHSDVVRERLADVLS